MVLNDDVLEFLEHSNMIEGVFDGDSLDQAVLAWQYVTAQEELTPEVVLETHRILALHSDLSPDEIGHFRKEQVWIGRREGKPWYAVPDLILAWCGDWTAMWEGARYTRDDEERAKVYHIRYEEIHPFIDYNGRSGRLLLNWMRVKMGLPILVIREEERFEYFGKQLLIRLSSINYMEGEYESKYKIVKDSINSYNIF